MFAGYQTLRTLRTTVAHDLGSRFRPQEFDRVVAALGPLPPDLLSKVVRIRLGLSD
jgi:hypothetical protein